MFSVSLNGTNNNNERSSKNNNGAQDNSSSSSNVLRRMFKSKSKTRTTSSNLLSSNGHSSQKRHHSTNGGLADTSCVGPLFVYNTQSPLRIELVDNQLALFLNPSTLFSIDSLRRFMDSSRPYIRDDRVRLTCGSDSSSFEILNVYLQSVNVQSSCDTATMVGGASGTGASKRRSKLDQHRMEKTRLSLASNGGGGGGSGNAANNIDREEDESINSASSSVYYFVKCRLEIDGVENRWEHVTKLFRPNEPINDLIQLRIKQ